MTIPDDVFVELHEIHTAHRVAAFGYGVTFNRIINAAGVKNIDAVIDKELWEFKSPQGAGRSTLSNQWHRAKSQGSTRLVVDLARTAITMHEALVELGRRLIASEWFDCILVIDKDGTGVCMVRV